MLGFLAAITENVLELRGLRGFLTQNYSKGSIFLEKNINAINFGELIAKKYSLWKYYDSSSD